MKFERSTARLLAARERIEFAEMLDSLDPEQWNRPSLCDGWTVRDVVTHTVAYLGQSRFELAINMLRTRGKVDRVNARALHDHARIEPELLVEMMRRGAEPAGAGALYGGRVALIEGQVQGRGVRRRRVILRGSGSGGQCRGGGLLFCW